VTVTVGPQTRTRTIQAGPAIVMLTAGTLVSFVEQFTIKSPAGQVSGKQYASAALRYRATITAASGQQYLDHGTSQAAFTNSLITDPTGAPIRQVNEFSETFQSTGFTRRCVENNDLQGNDPNCNNNGNAQ
jgi:hypothetical protein